MRLMMLQEKLKQATQGNHDTLEGLMFVKQIMGATLSLQQYKQILTTNYLVHKRFEHALIAGLDTQTAAELDMSNRQKTDALAADMAELKMPIPEYNTDNTAFVNNAEILGALYVLEGATLGGNVIVKRLKVNPELNSYNLNFNYYQVYGDGLIPNWKKFVEVLNNQPESTYNDAVSGAKKMFEYIATVQKESNEIISA